MLSVSNFKVGLLSGLTIAAVNLTCNKPRRPTAFESQVRDETTERRANPVEPFTLESSAFVDGSRIGREYTRDGENRMPSLSWKGAPTGTKSFALEVFDPDAAKGTFTHWLVWDIPPDARRVDVGVRGTNDAGKLGWSGPKPPPGSGRHHYVFRLYALGAPHLDLKEGATRKDLEAAVQGHVLGTTEVTGVYGK